MIIKWASYSVKKSCLRFYNCLANVQYVLQSTVVCYYSKLKKLHFYDSECVVFRIENEF